MNDSTWRRSTNDRSTSTIDKISVTIRCRKWKKTRTRDFADFFSLHNNKNFCLSVWNWFVCPWRFFFFWYSCVVCRLYRGEKERTDGWMDGRVLFFYGLIAPLPIFFKGFIIGNVNLKKKTCRAGARQMCMRARAIAHRTSSNLIINSCFFSSTCVHVNIFCLFYSFHRDKCETIRIQWRHLKKKTNVIIIIIITF